MGSGQPTSINGLVKLMGDITGQKIKIENKPARLLDIPRVVLDTNRLSKEFKLSASTSLKTGIAKTWQYVLSVED